MQSIIHHLLDIQFKQTAELSYDADSLAALVHQRLAKQRHGDLERWYQALRTVIKCVPSQATFRLDQATPTFGSLLPDLLHQQLYRALQTNIPWRKGPFNIHGININSEWRSDFKWRRIAPHVNLQNASILDIGCANGYLSLRMLGNGAKQVVGVEPSLGAWFQYLSATSNCSQHLPLWFVNLPFETLPITVNEFDYVFSLGVIYHRKNPITHLEQIKQRLVANGQLILEALTLPDDHSDDILIPDSRYSQMRNVWHVPKTKILYEWLETAGFQSIRLIGTSLNTPAEQRSTEWMRFHSLPQYLHPKNKKLTIEGYPAPQRSLIIASKR